MPSPSRSPEPLPFLAASLDGLTRRHGPGAVACLGSGRCSLETMGMLKRLCRARDWPDPIFHLDTGMRDRVEAAAELLDGSVAVSMREIEGADFVLAVGTDPGDEAPMLVLAMRQAVRKGAFAAVLDPRPVELPFEYVHVPAAPWELDAMMDRIDVGAACNLEGRGGADAAGAGGGQVDDVREGLLVKIEARARRATRGVIVCGTDATSLSTVRRAAKLARSLGFRLFYALPSANDFGAALVGLGRHCFPEILAGIEEGRVRGLLVVESDPVRNYPDRARLVRALDRLDLLAVVDCLPGQTAGRAQVFLPSATQFEARASYVNQEGRVRTVGPAFAGGAPVSQVIAASGGSHPPRTFSPDIPGNGPRPAWEILSDLSRSMLLDPGLGGAAGPMGPGSTGTAGTTAPSAFSAQSGPAGGAPGTVAPFPAGPAVSQPAGRTGGRLAGQGLDWLPGPDETPLLARLTPAGYPFRGERVLPGSDEREARPEPVCRPDPEPERPPPDGHFRLLLVEWTFGTEEMSGYSDSVRQAEPEPRLLMHTVDAAEAGLSQAGRVVLDLPGGPLEVRLDLSSDMARGVVILPRHRLLEWQRLDSRGPGGLEHPAIPRAAIRRAGP